VKYGAVRSGHAHHAWHAVNVIPQDLHTLSILFIKRDPRRIQVVLGTDRHGDVGFHKWISCKTLKNRSESRQKVAPSIQ
jgi:hypothetical protein